MLLPICDVNNKYAFTSCEQEVHLKILFKVDTSEDLINFFAKIS